MDARAPHDEPRARRWWAGIAVMTALVLALGALPTRTAGAAEAQAPDAAAAAVAPAASAAGDATLMVFNRRVAVFYVALPGVSTEERARRAHTEVLRALQLGGPGNVSATTTPMGTMVQIDEVGVFPLLQGDLAHGQTVDGVKAALRRALGEGSEARSLQAMLRAGGFALLGTAVLVAVLFALAWMRRRVRARLVILADRHGRRLAIGGRALFNGERIFGLARGVTSLGYYALVAIAVAEWLGFVLRRFPYTRRWGEELNESGMQLAIRFAGAIADALPGLAVAILIFLTARALLGMTRPFFNQVERGELTLSWLDRYTVRATRALVYIVVWLFALAMAYPYLPGAETEAFKGISVLLGVMLSLGSSNIVGQAVSGLILTYSKTLHIGEYVRIADVEGTVTEMGSFAIRIRTGLGEELTLPNAMIVGTITKNYSRAVQGEGYIVDTVMTIGYDTPWRQVHAMMIEGARRTEGILESPPPLVFQTALSDFYVEYRLVAQAIVSKPRPRAQVLADLHAHLQDVFNENGVQIMSPHYLGDPGQAKIVPPEHWSPPLAGRR